MSPESRHDALGQAAQAAPSVLVIFLDKILNVTPERWLTYMGIAFLALQAGYLLWRWRRDHRRERQGHAPHKD